MPDYTPTSQLSLVLERLRYVIESLTPTLAPSVLFTRHTDTTCKLENLSDPEGRIRRFEVKSESPSYGSLSWQSNTANLARVLRIRVGYPASDFYPEVPEETVDGYRYETEDLKSDDFRLIVGALESSDTWAALDADHPALSGFQFVQVRGEADEAGGKVRSLLYGIEFTETYGS